MRALIARFLASSRLDERRPVPEWVKANAAARRFEAEAEEVGRVLKRGVSVIGAPEDLHGNIMRAVRSRGTVNRRALGRWDGRMVGRLAVGVAGVGVLAFLVFGPMSWGTGAAVGRSSAVPPLATAGVVLEMGDRWPADVSSRLLTPLEVEQRKLGEDLSRTAEHLLACIP